MTTLALTYRPRVLADLVGQEASVRALGNLLRRAREAGRAPHQAFLFAGLRGTGKTSTARIIARALNCIQGPTATPCGVCDPCVAGERPDTSLDIVEIDAASRASVEDARALREQAQTRPAFCRYRVYIIDEVHMLSAQAFDALLKLLEEPPEHAIFVLATTELHDVPDTIKSRVQIYPFRLIPVGLIEQRLREVCEKEGVSFEPGSLRLVAEAGQGSMRDALTTLDRVIAAGDGQVREDLVREQLGIVPAVRVNGVLDAIQQGDAGAILDHCRELASLGADWVSFWRELMLGFRDRLEAEARRNPGPQDLLRWSRMLHLLLQRERDLRDSSLPRVVVELALITAAQLPHLAPLDALVSSGGSQTPRPGPAPRPSLPVPVPSPTKPAGPSAPPGGQAPILPAPPAPRFSDPESLRRLLGETLRGSAEGRFRSLGVLAQVATGLAWEPPLLKLRFPVNARGAMQDLEREQANPHLLAALSAVLPGITGLHLSFEGGTGERPEEILRRDPTVQHLLQATGGEIVEAGWEKEA
ncbi:MAG: DNA polymerase III subunit gamma/tau [Acidobacteria bacterium]|nr:DNA polymerase III subunit gamma/tau [Acidobacteriota bacterium]